MKTLSSTATRANNPSVIIPAQETGNAALIIALDIPGDAYVVRPEVGQRETVITGYDLSVARVEGNAITPAWSDPRVLLATFGLGPLCSLTEKTLREVFGPTARLRLAVERDPQTASPMLVFELNVARSQRGLRGQFRERYARETTIPAGAPVPVLSWEYSDVVSA